MMVKDDSIRKDFEEFRKQLEKGAIKNGYRALLDYIGILRAHFEKKYPDFRVAKIYPGQMDVTFFAVFPPALQRRHLKVAIVFNYERFRFEAWLCGRNRQVARNYWERIRDSRWNKYSLIAPGKDVDSVIECELATDINLGDPRSLTSKIERNAATFIADIEEFLAKQK